jgi:glucosamine-6-phosphate deaminase
MEVVITRDGDAAAEIVAGIVERVLAEHHAPVIGLATGSSPLPTYARLIDRAGKGAISFAHASAVVLDEYVGLAPGHPQSYRQVVRRELVDHVDLPPERLHTPDVYGPDLAEACTNYDRLLGRLGGVDVQLLGIGADGHVGFNEPGSSLTSRTRVKTLTDQTRADNARFFESLDDVPRHVVTQGLGTILEARHLVMVATGEAKAAPVAAAVEGPLTAMCPASVLQLHAHATVVVDEAAAGRLRLAAYYRETWEHKPSWQHP